MVQINFKLLEDSQTINNRILKALKTELTNGLTKAFQKSQQDITTLIQKAIVSSDTYNSISSGQLKAEFGLPDSDSRLDEILSFWSKIYAKFDKPKISNSSITGGFTIQMIQRDFRDVLGISAASFTTNKGDRLDWLEWLLLFGNKTIIKDYNIVFGNFKTSRTRMAIMRNATQGKWSVPNEYAGTINNNWITRVIDSLDNDINSIIENHIKGIL